MEGIEKRVSGTDGLTYETIDSLKGVTQLDRLNDKSAVVLVRNSDTGASSIETIDLP